MYAASQITAIRQQPGSIVCMRLSSRKCDSTPEFRNTPGCRYARRQPNNSHIGRTAPAESFAGCVPALFGLSGHSLCQFQWTAHSPGSKRTGQPRTGSSPGLSSYADCFQKVRQYTRISEHAWLQIRTLPVK